MSYQRNGKEFITIQVMPKDKRRLEIMKRRMGEDYAELYRPRTKQLMQEGERLFGHLPEWKRIGNEKEESDGVA